MQKIPLMLRVMRLTGVFWWLTWSVFGSFSLATSMVVWGGLVVLMSLGVVAGAGLLYGAWVLILVSSAGLVAHWRKLKPFFWGGLGKRQVVFLAAGAG